MQIQWREGRASRCAEAVRRSAEDSTAWAGAGRKASFVELLLREWREQQPQAFQLFGIQDAVEQRVIVAGGDHLSLGDVSEVGSRGQVNCCGKFWKEGSGMSKSTSKRARSLPVCFLISSIAKCGKTMPPSTFLGWGKGRKPAGNNPSSHAASYRSRTASRA